MRRRVATGAHPAGRGARGARPAARSAEAAAPVAATEPTDFLLLLLLAAHVVCALHQGWSFLSRPA